MRHSILPLISIAVVLMSSCERDANLELPRKDPELVVGCFLNPEDDSVIVTLSHTYPVFGPVDWTPRKVTDGVIWLSDGTDSVSLQHIQEGIYFCLNDKPAIRPGKTYYLRAQAPGYATVNSSCIMPDTLVKSLNYEVERAPNGPYEDSSYRVVLRWNDIPGEGHHYRVYVRIVDSVFDLSGITKVSYDFYFDAEEFSDKGRDGSEIITTPGEAYVYEQTTVLGRFIEIHLLTTDINYYKYNRSLSRATDDPFSEPYKIFSNIDGGKGAFCAYRSYFHRQKIF